MFEIRILGHFIALKCAWILDMSSVQFQTVLASKIQTMMSLDSEYSRCPKSGHPVFGVFEKRPVVKPSGFQTTSDNRTVMSGYRTFGWLTLQRPVIERSIQRPITGHNCPVFRHFKPKTGSVIERCPITGRSVD